MAILSVGCLPAASLRCLDLSFSFIGGEGAVSTTA